MIDQLHNHHLDKQPIVWIIERMITVPDGQSKENGHEKGDGWQVLSGHLNMEKGQITYWLIIEENKTISGQTSFFSTISPDIHTFLFDSNANWCASST